MVDHQVFLASTLQWYKTKLSENTVDYTVNIIERNGEYFLQEGFSVTEFQYVEQVTEGPFKARWEADVKRSWLYPAYRGLTDEYCRLQH